MAVCRIQRVSLEGPYQGTREEAKKASSQGLHAFDRHIIDGSILRSEYANSLAIPQHCHKHPA